jgi:hypothetical protein
LNRFCTSCGHGHDPDAMHCQTPDCECGRYTSNTADGCPECEHDVDEHDVMGCREYTPTFPRLVRCGCNLPYADPACADLT